MSTGMGLQAKQEIRQELTQKLTITPQMQQAINLLKLNDLEMEQEENRLLQENIFLEEQEEEFPKDEGEEQLLETDITVEISEEESFKSTENRGSSQAKEQSEEEEEKELSPQEGQETAIDEELFANRELFYPPLYTEREKKPPEDRPPLVERAKFEEGIQEKLISQFNDFFPSPDVKKIGIALIYSLDDRGFLTTEEEGERKSQLPRKFKEKVKALGIDLPAEDDPLDVIVYELLFPPKKPTSLPSETEQKSPKDESSASDKNSVSEENFRADMEEEYLPEEYPGDYSKLSDAEKWAYWREKAREALKIIQSLEPPGIGARNVQESLLIQIRENPEIQDKELAKRLIESFLKELENKNYQNIAKKLKISLRELKVITESLKKLSPYPLRTVDNANETYYTRPDFVIRERATDGEFDIIPESDYFPKLKFNNKMREVVEQKVRQLKKSLKSKENKEELNLKQEIHTAEQFIKAIEKRKNTIYRVVEKIVEKQKEFLKYGIKYLKPMTLQDIAEELNLHESTISRATTNKYILTPQGQFELKYFFSAGINTSNGGEKFSNRYIKKQIKEMIEKEDPRAPLSDSKIEEKLREMGIEIARRTIAKYREQMGIPPSRKRKKIF